MSSGYIHLSINDRAIVADDGRTLLDVCRAEGIHVPTLCHYPDLPDVGACRLCLVEIDGQRRPVPACTTPAEDGMVVRTDTAQLADLRRKTLELIFGERNHICPFCPRSGNCELQQQAYAHGMDHVRYDYLFPQLPVDNSHPLFTLDHNRCILCTRCVRACHEWVGAHVLDLDNRGHLTMLIADSGVPIGQSSCVSCGTCVTVCPTGALFEKRSAHWQGRLKREFTETICPGCGVGCRMHASVRHRQIGELRSSGGPNGNRVLCEIGRFSLVNPQQPRLPEIRARHGRTWTQRPLQEVLGEIARRLDSPRVAEDPSRVITLLSPRLPLETVTAFVSFMTDVVGSRRWTMLDGMNTEAIRAALGPPEKALPLAGLNDLDDADMFLLIGCHLERSHGVLASYVRRAVLQRRAKLVKINPNHTWLVDWTDLWLPVPRGRDPLALAAILKYLVDAGRTRCEIPPPLLKALQKLTDDDIRVATGVPADALREAARLYGEAQRPVILCGRGLSRHGPGGLVSALNLVKATQRRTPSGRWRLMELPIGGNSAGARLLGPAELNLETLNPQTAELAFVVLGDDDLAWPREWLNKLRAVTYVVALVARERDVLDVAHAAIPTATWSERAGTFVNLEGRVQKASRLMPPPDGCVDEIHFVSTLARSWRGLSFTWSPPMLPASIRHVGDDHMVPSGPGDDGVDLTGLEALTAS